MAARISLSVIFSKDSGSVEKIPSSSQAFKKSFKCISYILLTGLKYNWVYIKVLSAPTYFAIFCSIIHHQHFINFTSFIGFGIDCSFCLYHFYFVILVKFFDKIRSRIGKKKLYTLLVQLVTGLF